MSRTLPTLFTFAASLLVACSGGEDESIHAPAPAAARPDVHPPTDPRRLPHSSLISEVRVTLIWDESTQAVRRKIGDREFPKDDELQQAISEAHDAWKKKDKPDSPVTIDADTRVPWSEVINVVNIAKRCGIDKIEFAMGAPPNESGSK